nr:MAG TPA: hypothetical protein [Caudoviricetes sp.]
METNGYKGMLRDKLPKTVDIALKWCKAKERWINHTYDNFIGIFSENKEKDNATKVILGISTRYKSFDFHKTIMWDNMTDLEISYWKNVESWVNWFRTNYIYIQNEVNNSLILGVEINVMKQKIKKNFLSQLDKEWQDKLCNYLISTL